MALQQANVLAALNAVAQALQAQANLGHPVPQPREVNLIKMEPFDGTGDPISWIENFEKAATANGLTDARKLAVVPAYLSGTAATWLQERQNLNTTSPQTWIHANGSTAAQWN